MRDARAVDRMPRREVVGAVEHDARARHVRVEPCIVDTLRDRVHGHLGVQLRERVAPRFDLVAADRRRHVQDLPLQVREVDRIGVDERDRADARCREVHRGGRAARRRRSHAHRALLRLDADFVDEDVTGVAKELIVVHGESWRGGTGVVILGAHEKRAIAVFPRWPSDAGAYFGADAGFGAEAGFALAPDAFEAVAALPARPSCFRRAATSIPGPACLRAC